jgi:hypothetical protein
MSPSSPRPIEHLDIPIYTPGPTPAARLQVNALTLHAHPFHSVGYLRGLSCRRSERAATGQCS